MNMRVLRLTQSGLPAAWVSQQQAATLYVKGQVVWSLGDESIRLLGGLNGAGERSQLDVAPIIACAGRVSTGRHPGKEFTPCLSNPMLFRRDDFRCMYCGKVFSERLLTRDHIVPKVQNGPDCWTNVVACCRRCNQYKGGRTPEQAGMELLAVPFAPNVFEFMYLANRQIRGDQMSYLRARFTGLRAWLAA